MVTKTRHFFYCGENAVCCTNPDEPAATKKRRRQVLQPERVMGTSILTVAVESAGTIRSVNFGRYMLLRLLHHPPLCLVTIKRLSVTPYLRNMALGLITLLNYHWADGTMEDELTASGCRAGGDKMARKRCILYICAQPTEG